MGRAENSVEQYLIDQSKKHGFLCYKFTSPGTDGVPDRVLIGHGLTLFVETKAPGETLRKLQESIIKNMRLHGALVYVIDTRQGVDDLIKELQYHCTAGNGSRKGE